MTRSRLRSNDLAELDALVSSTSSSSRRGTRPQSPPLVPTDLSEHYELLPDSPALEHTRRTATLLPGSVPRAGRRAMVLAMFLTGLGMWTFVFRPESGPRARLPRPTDIWGDAYRAELWRTPNKTLNVITIEPVTDHRYTFIWLHVRLGIEGA